MFKLNLRFGLLILVLQAGAVYTVKHVLHPSSTPLVVESAKIRGPQDAPITIFEFSDFQCPFCRSMQSDLKEVLAEFPSDVRLVFKHFPLDFLHSRSRMVAEATECAGDQGKFWDYHDMVFAKVEEWEATENPEYLLNYYGKILGLDSKTFSNCMASGAKAGVVQRDKEEGRKMFVNSVPTLILNGNRILTKNRKRFVVAAIQQELEKLKGSHQ